jgi:hypothetical protein
MEAAGASETFVGTSSNTQDVTIQMTQFDTYYMFSFRYVQDVIHQKCNKHHTTLEAQENPLLKTLLAKEENRRLKRNWPFDLISGIEDSPLDDSPSRHCNKHNISV